MPEKTERKQRLKAWKDTEKAKARALFPLAPSVLGEFFSQLEARFEQYGCARDNRQARSVIDAMKLSDADANALLDWCAEHGGYCDCEIAANPYQHWLQNKTAD
jgi:hypothetical protein